MAEPRFRITVSDDEAEWSEEGGRLHAAFQSVPPDTPGHGRFVVTETEDAGEWSGKDSRGSLQSTVDTPGHGRFEVTETEDADEWSAERGDGRLQSSPPDSDTPGHSRPAEGDEDEISPLSG
jgi:hypothetical protein